MRAIHRNGVNRLRNATATVLGVFLLVPALADAQGPTLKTIAIDANASDWQTVLSNSYNTTNDGFGSGTCPSPDRDCGSVGQVGRDIRTFAWTYDPLPSSTFVSLYLDLFGNPSAQDFFFYMDNDSDQLMEGPATPDRVVYVSLNSGATAKLYSYNPASAGGDAMNDGTTNCNGQGCADGYRMPGSISAVSTLPASYVTVFPAPAKGFEVHIAWADLGIAPGTAVYFHVGSGHNTNLPGGLDDNCGGPDGTIGRFAFRGLLIDPSQSGAMSSFGSIDYIVSVTNSGTQPGTPDFFNLMSSAGLRVEISTDPGGLLLARDVNGDGDYTDPLSGEGVFNDTNANLQPDNGNLPVGASYNLRIRLSDLTGLNNVTDSSVLSGFYAEEPGVSDTAIFTTAIGDLTLTPNGGLPGVVGSFVDYRHTLHNALSTDTFTLQAISSLGWPLTYFSDPNGDGNPADGVQLAHDNNADGDFCDALDVAPSAPCTVLATTGSLVSGGDYRLVLRVAVPAATPFGTVDVTTLTGRGSAVNSFKSATATDTTTAVDLFSITSSYLNCGGTGRFAAAGASVYFPFVVANNQFSYTVASDSIGLAGSAAANGACALLNAGWTRRLWSDPNGDGNISDGAIIASTLVGRNGGTQAVILEVAVPVVPANLTDRTDVTATLAAATRSTAAELRVSKLIPYVDAALTTQGSFFTNCQTLFMQGVNLVANEPSRYRVEYRDPTLTVLRSVLRPTDSLGGLSDSYSFTAADLSGVWNVRLVDTGNGNAIVDNIPVSVEPVSPTVNTVTAGTDKLGYAATDSILATASMTNNNVTADYTGTSIEYVIQFDAVPPQYLNSGNTWTTTAAVAHTQANLDVGNLSTLVDSHAFGPTVFPGSGSYTLTENWSGSCGNFIASSTRTFYAGVTGASFLGAVPTTVFYRTETVTSVWQTVLASTAYSVAFYDSTGALISSLPATSDGGGGVTANFTTGGAMNTGTWNVMLYPSGYSAPAFVNLTDPQRISSLTFTLNAYPTLLRNASIASLPGCTSLYSGIFTATPPPNSLPSPANDCTLNYTENGSMTWCAKTTDMADDTKPMIFYEVPVANNSIRVTRSGTDIVITYTAIR